MTAVNAETATVYNITYGVQRLCVRVVETFMYTVHRIRRDTTMQWLLFPIKADKTPFTPHAHSRSDDAKLIYSLCVYVYYIVHVSTYMMIRLGGDKAFNASRHDDRPRLDARDDRFVARGPGRTLKRVPRFD